MKGSQIIVAFILAIFVASQNIATTSSSSSSNLGRPSQRQPQPWPQPQPQPQPQQPRYNPFDSNGQQQYWDGQKLVTRPVQQSGNYGSTANPRDVSVTYDGGKGNSGYPIQPRDVSRGANNAGVQPGNPLPDDQPNSNNLPQISQNGDEDSNGLGKSAQSVQFSQSGSNLQGHEIFAPGDVGLSLPKCNVRYFAFRIGSNKDAPSRYLTENNCYGLSFQYVQGGPNSKQLFIGYQIGQTWVYQSKSCPFYFIRRHPFHFLKLTNGPFASSKFRIHPAGISIIIESNFNPNTYWNGWSSVTLPSFPAHRYMIQYWP